MKSVNENEWTSICGVCMTYGEKGLQILQGSNHADIRRGRKKRTEMTV